MMDLKRSNFIILSTHTSINNEGKLYWKNTSSMTGYLLTRFYVLSVVGYQNKPLRDLLCSCHELFFPFSKSYSSSSSPDSISHNDM